jgi:hypothetical protein
MNPSESYDKIIVLLGDEKLTFQGNVIGTTPPITRNGNVNNQITHSDGTVTSGASNILLAFPLHLRLSYLGDVLYFSEAYPTTTDGQYLFGSLTIRRYKISTGEVDTYAGVDLTANPFNESYYHLIGSMGGNVDGPITSALFKYPMSIAVVPTDSELSGKENKNKGGVFHVIYIADHSNHAIKKIYPTMYTPSPTLSPTTIDPPSSTPTSSPTLIVSSPSASTRLANSFQDLEQYQQILVIVSCCLFMTFCCCYCCLHCLSASSSSSFSDLDDLESSNSKLCHSPSPTSPSSSSSSSFIQRWNQIQNFFLFQSSKRRKKSENERSPLPKSQGNSDDGRDGLLDVSISSSTSSIENEEWEEVIWNRTPNLNISKQYRLSGAQWPPPPRSHPPPSSLDRSPSHGIQSDSAVPWSTVTPLAGEMSTSTDSAHSPLSPAAHTPEATQRSSFLSQLFTGWWTAPSSTSSSLSSHETSSEHEIQLNDSPQDPAHSPAPATPKTTIRKWNSSKWDQVDDSLVSFNF